MSEELTAPRAQANSQICILYFQKLTMHQINSYGDNLCFFVA